MDIKELLTLVAAILTVFFTYSRWRVLPHARKQRLKHDLEILKLYKELDLKCDDIISLVNKEQEEIYSDTPLKLSRAAIIGTMTVLFYASLASLYVAYTFYLKLGIWGGLIGLTMPISAMKTAYDYYVLLPRKKST